MTEKYSKSVTVIGAGPGGYPAAFHAADLGMNVTLIDPEPNPGGVCLYRGCIPSKALLHVAKLLHEVELAQQWGVTFNQPDIDLDALREWKQQVVKKLTGGLGQLCRQRKINYIQGRARFRTPGEIVVTQVDQSDEEVLAVEHAIIASGSVAANIPGLPDSTRIMTSSQALDIESIPARLLIVGAGYIGLELGQVYAALGSKVYVVEMMSEILPGADRDLVRILAKRLKHDFQKIVLNTKVAEMQETDEGIQVTFEGEQANQIENTVFDKVLVAVGRKPNTATLSLENTAVETDRHGFIKVDPQRRTAVPNIFAIGDVAGQPMLAHKATHEAGPAVEAIAGKKTVFDPRAIPAVVFSDPEVAWCGLTEREAKEQGRDIKVARFPWQASGRAATLGHTDGLTKLIVDPGSEQVLGLGLAGANAGELIGQGVLAIEMGAVAEDLALSIQTHPTLSETIMEAAESVFGKSTHFMGKN